MRGRHHRRPAGHRLEVDDAERLVDRGAREHRRMREQLDHLGFGSIASSQTDVAALARGGARRVRRDLAGDRPCPARRRRGRAVRRGRSRPRPPAGATIPFWRVIRPTKSTTGARGRRRAARARRCPGPGGTARCRSRSGSRARAPGRAPAYAASTSCAHRRRDGDHRVRGLDGRALAERGEPRSPAPSCSSFQGRAARGCGSSRRAAPRAGASRGGRPRFAYQVCECTSEAPPRSAAIARSADIAWSAGSRRLELVHGRNAERVRAVGAHAAHLELDQLAKLAREVLDVHAGAAVDLRRILPGHQDGLHRLGILTHAATPSGKYGGERRKPSGRSRSSGRGPSRARRRARASVRSRAAGRPSRRGSRPRALRRDASSAGWQPPSRGTAAAGGSVRPRR